MSKERPILFSSQLARAILDGKKTQTRRVVKKDKCPYGQPGDRLWVCESWRVFSWDCMGDMAIEYKDGTSSDIDHKLAEESDIFEDWYEKMWMQSSDDCIKAGFDEDREEWDFENGDCPTRWRPSIHMPRWCSRIDLEVTGVRKERLQKTGELDAHLEGFGTFDDSGFHDCIDQFAAKWDQLNSHRGFSWASNPLVWVIDFARLCSS